jgi:hypothetical protein
LFKVQDQEKVDIKTYLDLDNMENYRSRVRTKRAIFLSEKDRRASFLKRHSDERNNYLRSRRMQSLLSAVGAAESFNEQFISEDFISDEGDVNYARDEKSEREKRVDMYSSSSLNSSNKAQNMEENRQYSFIPHSSQSFHHSTSFGTHLQTTSTSSSQGFASSLPASLPVQSLSLFGTQTLVPPPQIHSSLLSSSSSPCASLTVETHSNKKDDTVSWADQLTLPEMMISVPPDLNGGFDNYNDVAVDSAGWLVVPRPRGRACLVTAGRGVTIARDRNGKELARFSSLLPGGSQERTSAGVGTIIECVFVPALIATQNGVGSLSGRVDESGSGGVFVVIDVLAWKGLSYYDTGFDFRAFWAKCKFDEMNPVVAHSRTMSVCMDEDVNGGGNSTRLISSSTTATSTTSSLSLSYSFVLAPVFECDASGLLAAHSFSFSNGIERDGMLFCCKASRYEPGPTPLVLRWMDESCSSHQRFVRAEEDDDDNDSGKNRTNDWGSVFPARLKVIDGFTLVTSDGFSLGSLSDLFSTSGSSLIDNEGVGKLVIGDLIDVHCTAMVTQRSRSKISSSIDTEPCSSMNEESDDEEEVVGRKKKEQSMAMAKFIIDPTTSHESEARFSLMLPLTRAPFAHRHADSLSHLIWRAKARAYGPMSSSLSVPTLSDLLRVAMRRL